MCELVQPSLAVADSAGVLLLHTRGPDAFPDTMVLFHRTSEPFQRGTYAIHPLVSVRGDSPDPVAQLVARSHWDEEPSSWRSEAGSLRITRASRKGVAFAARRRTPGLSSVLWATGAVSAAAGGPRRDLAGTSDYARPRGGRRLMTTER